MAENNTFLFTSESVGEGHPGRFIIHFRGVYSFCEVFHLLTGPKFRPPEEDTDVRP